MVSKIPARSAATTEAPPRKATTSLVRKSGAAIDAKHEARQKTAAKRKALGRGRCKEGRRMGLGRTIGTLRAAGEQSRSFGSMPGGG